jgi:AcrR family transcriptional regulator
MRRRNLEIRAQLVQAAAQAIHRQGFHRTTLADIAREANFPLGNLYYYFKTKEDLCAAILDMYRSTLQARFVQWERLKTPRARIDAFVDMITAMADVAARSGCPFGTLASELSKERAEIAQASAGLFRAALEWLEGQFRAAGSGSASKGHAAHVVSVWQGSLFLAHTFGDPAYATNQARQLKQWVKELT